MSNSVIAKRRVNTLTFGGVQLPTAVLPPHFIIVGTTQSGKTLCIRMIMKDALTVGGQLHGRLLIYDGKREYYPMLIGMGVPPEQIYILNPADSRCAAWDLAGDINNRDDARNIVDLLIPEDQNRNDNPFFPLAVRSLTTEVIMLLHGLTPKKWKLNDVVNALRTPDIIRRFLNNTLEGREVRERYFTEAKEAVGGIISTIDARFISLYGTTAQTWARCSRSIRLTDWVKGNSAVLLGYDANRSAVDRINKAMFQRAAQLVTSLPENAHLTHGHTWVVLDELRFAGKMPMLPELISFGRTKGVKAILAPSDIDGLYEVYGENAANEMLAMCGNIGVLRIDSTKTRDWAAKLFGEYEAWEKDIGGSVTWATSNNHGSGGPSHGNSLSHSSSWNKKIVKRESILPSEFFNLKLTNRDNGMHGFFATPEMGAWRAAISPEFIDAHLPPNDPDALAFDPLPATADAPLRWDPEEERRYIGVNVAADAEPDNPHREGGAGAAESQPKLFDLLPTDTKPKKRSGRLPSW